MHLCEVLGIQIPPEISCPPRCSLATLYPADPISNPTVCPLIFATLKAATRGIATSVTEIIVSLTHLPANWNFIYLDFLLGDLPKSGKDTKNHLIYEMCILIRYNLCTVENILLCWRIPKVKPNEVLVYATKQIVKRLSHYDLLSLVGIF